MKWFIYVGCIWSLLFAAMSFYWAAGGMIGLESLGGSIYQKALEQDSELILMAWITGVIKLIGGILLASLLIGDLFPIVKKSISIICIVAGVFMMGYGAANFTIISLAGFNILQFDISEHALKWRLLFWEPFWVFGGLSFLFSGIYSLKKLRRSIHERGRL